MSRRCTLCGAGESELVFESAVEKFTAAMGRREGVRYYHCAGCGVLFQHPVLTSDEYTRLYESVQRSDETGYSSRRVPRSHLAKKRADAVFKWAQLAALGVFDLGEKLDVFEIGPGEGTLLASFRARGHRARGKEPLALYARHARERLGLDVETGYFGEADARPESADLVVLDNVLEHVPDPLGTLRLARRMLRPGGALYVAVPCAEVATGSNANIGHLTLWTRPALARALAQAGFEPAPIVPGRPVERPHEWVTLARVPRSDAAPRANGSAALGAGDAIGLEDLRARWGEETRRYARTLRLRRLFGPAYPMLKRLRGYLLTASSPR